MKKIEVPPQKHRSTNLVILLKKRKKEKEKRERV